MRRIATFSLSLVFGLFLLAGCDSGGGDNGGGGNDPAISVDKDQLELTVAGGASTSDTAQFTVNYTGLDGAPSASATGDLTVEVASEGDGSQTYDAYYDNSVGSIVEETVNVSGSSGDTEVTDSLAATISPEFISTSYNSTFAEVEGFEDQAVSTSGNTSVLMDSTTTDTVNTTGVASLEVDASSGGSLTIERRVSAPDADRFTFLVKPNSNSDFNLEMTFNEEGGTTSHTVTLPVNSADEWRKFTVKFDQLGDFNPVASRAGGNGPFTSVSFSADADVVYHLDALYFESADRKLAEVNDFETTTLAYGPPFCPPTFSTTQSVAEESDGFVARTVTGGGCFGYNYDRMTVDFDGEDVVSFLAQGTSSDSIYVFLETAEGAGQFTFGNGIQVPVPEGSWGKVTVRVDSLGAASADSIDALQDPGLNNVGFEARGNDPDIMIDDIRLEKASGGGSNSLW